MTKNLTRLAGILFGIAVFFVGFQAYASSTASTTANAVATVIASISIAKNQDLNFGNAAPGDNAKAVPGTDTTNAAAFNVTGQANTAYNITIPAGTVAMTTAGAAAVIDRTINVTTFASNPNASGTLDNTGAQLLYVGASRAAIRATQQAGSYTGTFTVTVTYP